jgi:hypothetical protein
MHRLNGLILGFHKHIVAVNMPRYMPDKLSRMPRGLQKGAALRLEMWRSSSNLAILREARAGAAKSFAYAT